MADNYDYSEGAKLALENAAALYYTAIQAEKSQYFGTACSLFILGSEEIIKSIFCVRKHYYPSVALKDLDFIFKKHELKHTKIKQLLNVIHDLLAQANILLPRYKDAFNAGITSEGQPISDDLKQQFRDVITHLDRVGKTKKQFTDDELETWWDAANELKKDGLYVGRAKDGCNWIKPNSMDSGTTKEARKYATALLHLGTAYYTLTIMLTQMSISVGDQMIMSPKGK